MIKVAVLLSGCGYLDGAEIREAVLALTSLDRNNVEAVCVAPNIKQNDVVDHLTGKKTGESRNILVEAARIARGKVTSLQDVKADDFDAIVIPGGWGVAKNLSNLAEKGAEVEIVDIVSHFIKGFLDAKKPIGAICISPAIIVAAAKNAQKTVKVTLGHGNNELIEKLGGLHQDCNASNIVIDNDNNIVSTPAYMLEERLSDIASGIDKLVHEVVLRVKN